MNELVRRIKMMIHTVLLGSIYWLMFRKRRQDGRKWIVLVRCDHLGDLLCSISVLRHFLDYYHRQGFAVALVVNQPYRELAEKLLPFDRIIAILPKKTSEPLYRAEVMMQLYSMKIEVLISLVACNIAFFIEIFSFAKIKHHSYLKKETDKLRMFGKYYDFHHERQIGVCIQDQHESLFREITGESATPEKLRLRELLPELAPIPDHPERYYLVFPGASAKKHCWGTDKFSSLINSIQKDFPEYTPVILGSGPDYELEQKILSGIEKRETVLPLCGKTDLKALFAWVRDAKFVIGNDSGGIHLAAAWDVPSFSIIHGGDFGSYLPNPYYQLDHPFYHRMDCFSCVDACGDPEAEHGRQPCLNAITPDEVYTAIKEFLSGDPHRD